MNLRDLIRETVENISVFNKRDVLSQDYLPSTLPAREKQFRELAIYFRDVVSGGSVSVVLVGKAGTGKTVTAKKFGKEFIEVVKEKNLRVAFVHINCYKHKTLYLSLIEVARQINLSLPNRGLSAQELFGLIHEHLEKKKIHLIIAFDGFDYLANISPVEDIYLLTRVYDELGTQLKSVSYIFIIRDLSSLMGLEDNIKENIVKNVIEFPPYTSSELYQILKERVFEEKAFREGTIGEDVLRFISNLYGSDTGGSGNARLAIEALDLAGKIADSEDSQIVTIEHAKKAVNQINPELIATSDIIKELNLHELFLLKAVIDLKKKKNIDFLPMGLVEEEYKRVAENLGVEPRKHTQVYEYVRRLKVMGLIVTNKSRKGYRGRTTLVSLSVPLLVEELITEEIEKKLQSHSE